MPISYVKLDHTLYSISYGICVSLLSEELKIKDNKNHKNYTSSVSCLIFPATAFMCYSIDIQPIACYHRARGLGNSERRRASLLMSESCWKCRIMLIFFS